ncbi:akirin [Drosophila ananassae]|uniref:akirin n=1 Tax=Drosophila ananassae TaxID=7217 RepID=UPI0013A5F0DD|nr:akirin [Drosophila ananassae]
MSCLTLKRPLTFEEDFADNVPLKRRRLQIQINNTAPEPKPKATRSDKVPDDIQESLKYLPPLPDMDSSDSEMEIQTASANSSPVRVKASEDVPRNLFTTKQLYSMCRSMIEQSEGRLREEYEQVLTQKMAEQYDTFIKFTHDQMYRDNGQCSSYLK